MSANSTTSPTENTALPTTDHIARFCSQNKLKKDNTQVTGEAFILKTKKDNEREEYLSVNWLEYFCNISRNDQLDKLRSALKKSLPYIRLSAKIAVLNVTESVDYVKNNTPNSIDIRVLHKPTKDESHSGIFETILDEAIISELLADCVTEPLYPAM